MQWWRSWLLAPPEQLTRHISAWPRQDALPPCLVYSDASSVFGLGGVLLLPASREAFFFRVRVRQQERIEFLETEAAYAAKVAFSVLADPRGYTEQVAFVDSNVALSWIVTGHARDNAAVEPILDALWLRLASRQAQVWWERVASVGNLADLPSRGYPPLLPSTWSVAEVAAARFAPLW